MKKYELKLGLLSVLTLLSSPLGFAASVPQGIDHLGIISLGNSETVTERYFAYPGMATHNPTEGGMFGAKDCLIPLRDANIDAETLKQLVNKVLITQDGVPLLPQITEGVVTFPLVHLARYVTLLKIESRNHETFQQIVEKITGSPNTPFIFQILRGCKIQRP